MLRFCVVVFCVFTTNVIVTKAFTKWDGLKVTWGFGIPQAFADLPRTETEAIADGFTMLSDCGATRHFAGKRYAKNGDTAVVLLYDSNGYVAGIQAGFPKTQPNGYPSSNLKNHPFVLYEDKQFITAYFVDPKTICSTGRTSAMFSQNGTGTDLFIQNGTSPSHCHLLKIPHDEVDLQTTKWTRGPCFRTMGTHYWYNLRTDMSCDEFYPVFLLYDGGELNAFGWGFNANLSSTRYEHPSKPVFGIFLNPVPNCLYSQDHLTTLHIYLTNTPRLITC